MSEGITLATAYVQLTSSTRDLGNQITRDMRGIGKQAGDVGGASMGKALGGKLMAAFAALGIGTLIGKELGKAVNDAIGKFEALNKVDVVFENSAGAVKSFAKQGAKSLGMSEKSALEAAGTFGNLLTATGIAEDQAADFSTTMVNLGADLASFNNTSVDDALEALRSGLSGETEPLKRFGINLQDAILKQEALNQGIYDGKGMLTPAQKAQAAYAVIMHQSAKAQGDFARTSAIIANKQKIVAAQWEDLRAKIGEKLLPIVEKALDFVSRLIDGFSNMGKTGAPEWFDDLKAAAEPVVAAVMDFAKTALPLIQKWWSSNGSSVMRMLTGAFDVVAGAVTFLIEGVTTVIKLFKGDWKGAAESAGGAISGLGQMWKGVIDIILGRFAAMGTGFRNAINTVIIPAINKVIDALNKLPGVNIGKVGYITSSATDSRQTSRSAGLQQLAEGGIATGPTTGYPAILHGTEAILPLNNPRRAAAVAAQAGIGGTVINVSFGDVAVNDGYRDVRKLAGDLVRSISVEMRAAGLAV